MSSLAAIDISDAATRVEVILREPKPGGLPLAMVVRNLDGERGRRLLASARIPPNEVDHEGNAPKMAGYNRTSALTQGAGQTNDVLSTLVHNEGLPSQFEIDEGVPRLVREVVRSQHDTSRIFNNRGKQDELECCLRVHAFPPRDPAGAPAPTVGRMFYGHGDEHYREFRKCHDREGGRMHGHIDEDGTDAVVLLNLGSAEFFVDVGDRRHKTKCMAQRAKECWCVGSGGHWATIGDCENLHEKGKTMWASADRLCRTCAGGGVGVACATCRPVALASGDVIVFDGRAVFHGVSRVLSEREPPPPPPPSGAGAAPPLPEWASRYLDRGFRLSVMWRYANREIRRRKKEQETSALAASGSGGSVLAGLFAGHLAGAAAEGGGGAAAMAMASASGAMDGLGGLGGGPPYEPEEDPGEDSELEAAIAFSRQLAGAAARADDATEAELPAGAAYVVPDQDELRKKRLARLGGAAPEPPPARPAPPASSAGAAERPRPEAIEVPDDSDDEPAAKRACARWSCRTCTLLNDPDTLQCDACGTPNPAIETMVQ